MVEIRHGFKVFSIACDAADAIGRTRPLTLQTQRIASPLAAFQTFFPEDFVLPAVAEVVLVRECKRPCVAGNDRV